MGKQRYTTEEIIHKLREADVLIGQGQAPAGMRTRSDDLWTTHCRLNEKRPMRKHQRAASKPSSYSRPIFFDRRVSSLCGSVLSDEFTCQKPDIYLHILLHTA